jgi:hypothetical protein
VPNTAERSPTVGRHTKERKGDRQPDPILKLRKTKLVAKKVIERDASERDDGADYFDDDVDIDFEELDGAEVVAQLEPRQFKNEPPTGTRTKSSTLQLSTKAEKIAANVPAEGRREDDKDVNEDDFEDIPF